MTYSEITATVIVVVALFAILYDIWVAVKEPGGWATISWVILSSSKKYPAIAFAAGFLCGHLFFQNCTIN